MSRRIGLVVLAALCAVALSAVAASGASAAGTTAFTCVKTVGGPFHNSHCNPAAPEEAGGPWAHVEIAENLSTGLTVTAIGEPTTLKSKIAGANTTLTATKGVDCVNCMIENHKDANGHMDVTGAGGTLTYTGVTISIESCKVVEEMVTTKPLTLTTFAEGGKTRAEIKPTEGSVEAVINLENAPGKTCPLPKEIPVEGLAKGTATGATAKFETATTGTTELHIGVNNASLKGELTLTIGPTGGTQTPGSLTETAV